MRVAMSEAAPQFVAQLAAEGKIHGILSLGGGGGTALGTAAMRALADRLPEAYGVDPGQWQHRPLRRFDGHFDDPEHRRCRRA